MIKKIYVIAISWDYSDMGKFLTSNDKFIGSVHGALQFSDRYAAENYLIMVVQNNKIRLSSDESLSIEEHFIKT